MAYLVVNIVVEPWWSLLTSIWELIYVHVASIVGCGERRVVEERQASLSAE